MSVTVTQFRLYRIWSAALVFLVMMAIDFLYYGLINKAVPYQQDLVGKLIWTAVLAILFTGLYNQAATWHADGDKGFTGKKILNSIICSLFFTGLMIAVIALSGYLINITFIYLLEAFRGIPESGSDMVVLGSKVIISGLVLEAGGRDQTEERRNG